MTLNRSGQTLLAVFGWWLVQRWLFWPLRLAWWWCSPVWSLVPGWLFSRFHEPGALRRRASSSRRLSPRRACGEGAASFRARLGILNLNNVN